VQSFRLLDSIYTLDEFNEKVMPLFDECYSAPGAYTATETSNYLVVRC